MIRKSLFKSRPSAPGGFRLRGQDVQRIETFSDGVFAFAVTLLIVSLEVPKTFEELLVSMRGFLAFGICFALLVLLWYDQHVFFRRYALDDGKTIFLNACLLFIVLFYVYPLKFLFSLLFTDLIYGAGRSPFAIAVEEMPRLMVIYGLGYVAIYVLFLLMYRHALRRREELELTALEAYDTKSKIYAYLILIGIGAGAIVLALVLPARIAGVSGFFYMLILPALTFYFRRRYRVRRRLFGIPLP